MYIVCILSSLLSILVLSEHFGQKVSHASERWHLYTECSNKFSKLTIIVKDCLDKPRERTLAQWKTVLQDFRMFTNNKLTADEEISFLEILTLIEPALYELIRLKKQQKLKAVSNSSPKISMLSGHITLHLHEGLQLADRLTREGGIKFQLVQEESKKWLTAAIVALTILLIIFPTTILILLARTLGQLPAAFQQIADNPSSALHMEGDNERKSFIEVVELKTLFKSLNKMSETITSEIAKYRVLFELSSDAVLLLDTETMSILDANQASIDLYGYSHEEFLLLTAVDLSAEKEQTRSIFGQAKRVSIPKRIHKKKDGSVLPVEISGNFFEYEGKKMVIASIRNISDRIKAETAKENLEQELRQSQKLKAIGTLAGGIAHDFNNILTGIIGYTELALEEVKTGTSLSDDLKEIYSAGERAKSLVQQILTFARKSEDQIQPVQISLIAKEVLKFIRSSIPATIEIKSRIESKSIIAGSPTQIYQVLMNLCTNAAQAMSKKGGTLEMSVEDSDLNEHEEQYVKISVRDTGQGIAPEDIASIFDPYFTTKQSGEGTGLGLAMVHGIVESYKGKIAVESKLGIGTTFYVYLPVTNQMEMPYVPAAEESPRGTENILFVDDEIAITKISKRVLSQLGYIVSTETSSIRALELFREKQDEFDLVITDMTMPEMTGTNLAKELVSIRKDIPIIMCTGYNKNLDSEESLPIEIKALRQKPLKATDLARVVRQVLDESS